MGQPQEKRRRVLDVPAIAPTHYEKNFIRSAVCELRFPTLLEYEKSPPAQFSKAVRKEYPHYQEMQTVNVDTGGAVANAKSHAYHSRDRKWTATVRASAVSLQTAKYSSIDEFESRMAFVLASALGTIDSDFFTRVGIRYTNVLPYAQDDIGNWINSDLILPLKSGTFGDVDEHWQRVRGVTDVGGYMLSHGFSPQPVQPGEPPRKIEYVLDLDFFQEDVDVSQTMKAFKQLHDYAFRLFHWSLGPAAKAYLGAK